jgi:hypothetical protein
MDRKIERPISDSVRMALLFDIFSLISKRSKRNDYITGSTASRSGMGVPDDWLRIVKWLYNEPTLKFEAIPKSTNKVLCPELPVLSDYFKKIPDSYWEEFPKNELPKAPFSDISAEKLNDEISKRSAILTESEISRAKATVDNLKYGASSFQKSDLPPCFEKNAPGIESFGKEVSDTIASWLKKKFAAGPFDEPPVKNFRVNPLIAIQQNGKVRPVLNMSEPKGNSFNENVDTTKLEKVFMSSSKQFSKSLFDAGKNAKFSKFDFVDAYKNVPEKIFDLRLQGFVWKEKFLSKQGKFSERVQQYKISICWPTHWCHWQIAKQGCQRNTFTEHSTMFRSSHQPVGTGQKNFQKISKNCAKNVVQN